MSLSSTELHVKVQYLVYVWRCLVNAQGVTLDRVSPESLSHIWTSKSFPRRRTECGSLQRDEMVCDHGEAGRVLRTSIKSTVHGGPGDNPRRATVTGNLKRRGPALPGLT